MAVLMTRRSGEVRCRDIVGPGASRLPHVRVLRDYRTLDVKSDGKKRLANQKRKQTAAAKRVPEADDEAEDPAESGRQLEDQQNKNHFQG